MKTFIEGVKTQVTGLVCQANGFDYLPWPIAVALAERPTLSVRTWDNSPLISFFGGVVVAVEGNGQTTWLPVLNLRNQPVSLANCSVRDINDSLSRCRAKAIALNYGVGLSLYAGFGERVNDFLRSVGVRPDSDLSQVDPLTSQKPGSKGATYVDWVAAYTSAKVTDPDFRFQVVEFNDVDEDGVQQMIPAKRVAGGWMVAVDLTYKGQQHTEWLPIMGVQEVNTKAGVKKMDHQPLAAPTTHDWNRAVMRCLTRGVAVLTGYGLSVYAGEDVASLHREAPEPAVAPPQAEEAVHHEAHVHVADLDGMEELPDWEQAKPEPSHEEVSKLIVRIGNIGVIEGLTLAKADVEKRYAGTKAFEVLMSALIARKRALNNPIFNDAA